MSFSGEDLGAIKLGINCGACGPAIQAVDNCSEYGPEWVFDSPNSCNICGFNCLGSACTVGTKANCRKFQYTGSNNQCCLNQKPSGFPNVTCNPNLNNLAPVCSPIVQNYCSSGDKIFTDPICQQWAVNNVNQAFTMKKTYCSPNNIKSDKNCRNWVSSSEVQGKIDDIMVVDYCQNNTSDPLCSCVLSEMTCPNKFDSKCISQGGYKSADMMNVQCPNVMNCTQFVGLSPGAQAIATNVSQNCSSSTGSATQQNSQQSNSTGFTFSSLLNSNSFIIIMLILFLIIINILIIIFVNNSNI